MFFSSPLPFWVFLGLLNPSVLPLWLRPLSRSSGFLWEAPSPGLEGQEWDQPWDSGSRSGGAGKGGIWGFGAFLVPPPGQHSEPSLVQDSEEPSLGNDPKNPSPWGGAPKNIPKFPPCGKATAGPPWDGIHEWDPWDSWGGINGINRSMGWNQWDGMGLDGMGSIDHWDQWDGMGWDGINGMGWNGMGSMEWDGMNRMR